MDNGKTTSSCVTHAATNLEPSSNQFSKQPSRLKCSNVARRHVNTPFKPLHTMREIHSSLDNIIHLDNTAKVKRESSPLMPFLFCCHSQHCNNLSEQRFF